MRRADGRLSSMTRGERRSAALHRVAILHRYAEAEYLTAISGTTSPLRFANTPTCLMGSGQRCSMLETVYLTCQRPRKRSCSSQRRDMVRGKHVGREPFLTQIRPYYLLCAREGTIYSLRRLVIHPCHGQGYCFWEDDSREGLGRRRKAIEIR
jgi:hypothetical protein